MRPRSNINEWHTFTRIWVENVRHLKHEPHYCRLAVAMAAADSQRHDWDHYVDLAIKCKEHHTEMEDARLQKRKAAAEGRGWVFEFTGHGWVVTQPSLMIPEPTLARALRGVEGWGDGTLAHWAEQHAAYQALRAARAIQEGAHE